MKRVEWEFQVTAGVLKSSCDSKVEYHARRLGWWKNELDLAESELKEKGVEFREAGFTGGSRLDAVVDPQKANRVHECRKKVEWHTMKVKEYSRWLSTFSHVSESQAYQLHADDIEFFGIYDMEDPDGN